MNNNLFEGVELPEDHKKELERLGKTVEEKIVNYTDRGIEKDRREVLREAIDEESSGSSELATKPSVVQDTDDAAPPEEKKNKLQELVNYTASHGPIKASLAARKLGDPWLEDELHDALISFHDELVQRGKLKE